MLCLLSLAYFYLGLFPFLVLGVIFEENELMEKIKHHMSLEVYRGEAWERRVSGF